MNKITSFFSSARKRKLVEDSQQAISTPADSIPSDLPSSSSTSVAQVSTYVDASISPDLPALSSTNEWPDCWTTSQKTNYQNKYEWLTAKGGKLGCVTCGKVGNLGVEKTAGARISREWSQININYNGTTRSQQLSSLRKKVYEHRESAGHKSASLILTQSKENRISSAVEAQYSREKEVTQKIFRTAYKVAKENQSFNNFESEIDVQELNGLDMGRILHSRKACKNIVQHVSTEMRTNLFKKIVENRKSISIILDESTTLSRISTLIIYLRTSLDGSEPVNVFVDLVELASLTANGIFDSLMSCLKSYGMSTTFLSSCLIGVVCDGAAVMLGRKNGVAKLLRDEFPDIVVWHCANHRLELSVGDVVKSVSNVNRFRSFMDKLYSLYHASPKNSRELSECAAAVEVQLLKIGRVLDTRWVASSFRTVNAVWNDFPALVEHFKKEASSDTRDSRERAKYQGLLSKITSTDFLLDLALMYDSLQELSEVSLELQNRACTIWDADNKINNLAKLFEYVGTNPGDIIALPRMLKKT